MAFNIYKSDGTLVTIPDNAIDASFYDPTGGGSGGPGNGLGTQLVGNHAVNYGPAIAQNFLQLQENFSSAPVPNDATSLQGQLWFNRTSSSTGNLYVRVVDSPSGGILNWAQIVVGAGGVAPTADKLSVARSISITNDATWSVNFDGSANVSSALTLATVNATVGTYGSSTDIPVITVNAKGLITNVTTASFTASTATNLSGGTTGALPYQSAPNVTAFLTAGTSANVLIGGASAPSWTSTLPGLTFTGTGSYSGVTLSGTVTNATDATTKAYVDTNDYLNLPPLAGILKDNTVPISADFKYGLGKFNSYVYKWVDNKSRQVIFFETTTPVGDNEIFRAYRYSDVDAYIYDTDHISAPFLAPTEKIAKIYNMGTNFAVLYLVNKTSLIFTRIVIARTYGSSEWQDWTLGYDVSSLYAAAGSMGTFSLVPTPGGDRILFLTGVVLPASQTLYVYDSSLTLLRSQVVFDWTMLDTTDHLGAGRVPVQPANNTYVASYSQLGNDGAITAASSPFTWDPFTETLYEQNHAGFYYTTTPPTGNNFQGTGMSVSWVVPRSWLDDGTGGSPVNLIPIKSGAFRYHLLTDTTWDTNTGGMCQQLGAAAYLTTLVTDEYSGNIYQTVKQNLITHTVYDLLAVLSYDSGYIYQTFSLNNLSRFIPANVYVGQLFIPDGSPWAKTIGYNGTPNVIDDNVFVLGFSTSLGIKYYQTTFSTTSFESKGTIPNDTLKLNSTSYIESPQLTAPASVQAHLVAGCFGVAVAAGVGTHYHAYPGELVYTITASGVNRTYTSTGLTMPVIPTTIGIHTNLSSFEYYVWNGNIVTPVFWAFVQDQVTPNYGQLLMAKYSGGSWSIVATGVLQGLIDTGKTARADTINLIQLNGFSNAILTESGRILFWYVIPGIAFYWSSYDTTIDIVTDTNNYAYWASGGGTGNYDVYSSVNGGTFGFSSTFGYYETGPNNSGNACAILSSKDITGFGPDLTENQWFNNSPARYLKWFSTESTAGLVAYVSAFPLFIGGYYCTTPTQSVALAPNTINYVYANKAPGDRTTVTISVSPILLPSTFSRVLLSAITTDTQNITGQVDYPVIQTTSVGELSDVVLSSITDGNVLTWDGTQWVNSANGAANISSNTRFGTLALSANTAGSNNVAIGTISLMSNTTGIDNVAVGSATLEFNISGSGNTAVGEAALNSNTVSNNTAVGFECLYLNITGTGLTAAGYRALRANTVSANTAFGNLALTTNTTGVNCTAVGFEALTGNISGATNTGIGYQALTTNSTGFSNTAVGGNALGSNTSGTTNVAVGVQSMLANVSGSGNTAIGTSSLVFNVSGSSNIAIGTGALYSNTASNNTAVGHESAYNNTTGTNLTAVGYQALTANTTGLNNTGSGYFVLTANTTGSNNTATGVETLRSNITGFSNTAVGVSSQYYNTSGGGNTSLGMASLVLNTVSNNTAVGTQSMYYTTTGSDNTAIGSFSLYTNTTGINNTAVGRYAGWGSGVNDNTTGSNNTFIGYQSVGVTSTTSDTIVLGNSSIAFLRCQQSSISSLSDIRDKTNISDIPLGLNFINNLRPVKFDWNMRDGGKIGIPEAGFIAQELQQVSTEHSAEWVGLVLDENPDKLEASPGKLLPIMVKAIQELSLKLEQALARIAELEAK